ncbi:hypothetical protein HDU76_007636 [Blyttiomyces sp. JEL0837]|nr:hypothetical protein HDU76_007636 [Blyttiomyces sp. JEL0837]
MNIKLTLLLIGTLLAATTTIEAATQYQGCFQEQTFDSLNFYFAGSATAKMSGAACVAACKSTEVGLIGPDLAFDPGYWACFCAPKTAKLGPKASTCSSKCYNGDACGNYDGWYRNWSVYMSVPDTPTPVPVQTSTTAAVAPPVSNVVTDVPVVTHQDGGGGGIATSDAVAPVVAPAQTNPAVTNGDGNLIISTTDGAGAGSSTSVAASATPSSKIVVNPNGSGVDTSNGSNNNNAPASAPTDSSNGGTTGGNNGNGSTNSTSTSTISIVASMGVIGVCIVATGLLVLQRQRSGQLQGDLQRIREGFSKTGGSSGSKAGSIAGGSTGIAAGIFGAAGSRSGSTSSGVSAGSMPPLTAMGNTTEEKAALKSLMIDRPAAATTATSRPFGVTSSNPRLVGGAAAIASTTAGASNNSPPSPTSTSATPTITVPPVAASISRSMDPNSPTTSIASLEKQAPRRERAASSIYMEAVAANAIAMGIQKEQKSRSPSPQNHDTTVVDMTPVKIVVSDTIVPLKSSSTPEPTNNNNTDATATEKRTSNNTFIDYGSEADYWDSEYDEQSIRDNRDSMASSMFYSGNRPVTVTQQSQRPDSKATFLDYGSEAEYYDDESINGSVHGGNGTLMSRNASMLSRSNTHTSRSTRGPVELVKRGPTVNSSRDSTGTSLLSIYGHHSRPNSSMLQHAAGGRSITNDAYFNSGIRPVSNVSSVMSIHTMNSGNGNLGREDTQRSVASNGSDGSSGGVSIRTDSSGASGDTTPRAKDFNVNKTVDSFFDSYGSGNSLPPMIQQQQQQQQQQQPSSTKQPSNIQVRPPSWASENSSLYTREDNESEEKWMARSSMASSQSGYYTADGDGGVSRSESRASENTSGGNSFVSAAEGSLSRDGSLARSESKNSFVSALSGGGNAGNGGDDEVEDLTVDGNWVNGLGVGVGVGLRDEEWRSLVKEVSGKK